MYIYIYIYVFISLGGSETIANPSDQFVHKPGPGIPTSSTPNQQQVSYHISMLHYRLLINQLLT